MNTVTSSEEIFSGDSEVFRDNNMENVILDIHKSLSEFVKQICIPIYNTNDRLVVLHQFVDLMRKIPD